MDKAAFFNIFNVKMMWTLISLTTPTTPIVIDYQIFCLQNIKPRCVLISIDQKNPKKGFSISEFAAHIYQLGLYSHFTGIEYLPVSNICLLYME